MFQRLTRLQRLGLMSTIGAVLAVGATALVVQALEGTGPTVAATDTATPAAMNDPARATPTDPSEPVAVEPTPEPTPEPAPVENVAVAAQMTYVFAHWNTYNSAEWGVLGENDCVNFVSQALIERGWAMDDVWNSPRAGNAYNASTAWRSSTALMKYIESTGRATALTDAQRDQVKVGDVVQFDWDNSGDRDHTGIVSKVETVDGKISISYAGHTEDTDYRTVDFAITERHPGGTAYYWSIP